MMPFSIFYLQHYNVKGSILLGKQVAAKIAEMLKERKLWVEPGYSLPEGLYIDRMVILTCYTGSSYLHST